MGRFSSATDFDDHIFGAHIYPTTGEVLICPAAFSDCSYHTTSFNDLKRHIILLRRNNATTFINIAQTSLSTKIIKFLESKESTKKQ